MHTAQEAQRDSQQTKATSRSDSPNSEPDDVSPMTPKTYEEVKRGFEDIVKDQEKRNGGNQVSKKDF